MTKITLRPGIDFCHNEYEMVRRLYRAGDSGTTIGITKAYRRNPEDKSKWLVQQHYGKCNSYQAVTEDHKILAEMLVERLNKLL